MSLCMHFFAGRVQLVHILLRYVVEAENSLYILFEIDI